MSPMKRNRMRGAPCGGVKYPLSLLLVLMTAFAATALAVVYPTDVNMYYQTNGRSDPATIGDWYTTTASGSTDDIHRIFVEITAPQLASCGGTCTITIQDAEVNAGPGPLDEIAGPADPARFQLRAANGVTVLQTQTVPGGSADGTNVLFTVNAVGWYQITSETGAFPIFGVGTANQNDDDNGFRIDVPFAGGLTGGLVGDRQATFERAGSTGTLTMYFLVGPAAGTTTLSLRNFDRDSGGAVTYTRPGGGTVAGTGSGNGVWNNGGTINTGADTVVANTTIGSGAIDAGVWTFTSAGWTTNNQMIFEVLTGGATRLNTFHALPQRAGSFTMTAPTILSSNIGTAVDHVFTVTNTFYTPDIINFTTTGTAVNWTATILTAGGAALPDTDGNGQPDTGIMAVGATANYILRVTPNAGAIGSSVTTINGVSWMDNRVTPGSNTTVTLAKTTWLRPTIAKAFVPASMGPNGTSTITFTLTNLNTTLLTSLAFTDTYPAGLVNATPLTVGGTCAGVTTTAVAGGGTFNVTAGTLPAGAPGICTITVAVTTPTAGTYDNAASGASGVIAGTAIVAGPVSNTATLTVSGPSLTVVKASQTFSDPFNGTINPKSIPGAFVTYSVTVTNTGPGGVDPNAVVITDAIPANTDLFVGNMGGPGSGPVLFVNGVPSSGLTYTFTALDSITDDVSFSDNGGLSFVYEPQPDINGVDPDVTHIRINPKGTMPGNGGGNPSFEVRFRVRVE
jgi:uncharacterized repeat protein (TIGR01451 family)